MGNAVIKEKKRIGSYRGLPAQERPLTDQIRVPNKVRGKKAKSYMRSEREKRGVYRSKVKNEQSPPGTKKKLRPPIT